MKKLFMSLVALMMTTVVSAQIVREAPKPSEGEFRKAVKTLLYKSSCTNLTPERLKAMEITQDMINHFTTTEFKAFWSLTDWYEIENQERFGVPYFLRASIDKILKEVRSTKLKDGQVAVWLLYNMAYVIKTPTHTFGIDLRAKRLDELMKYIEFSMITHAHGDHWAYACVTPSKKQGKPLYANFNIKGGAVTRVKHGDVIKFDDITIRCTVGDHNSQLKNFVVAYEIDCGPRTNHTVIYHTGDSNNYTQLNPQSSVDIFIPHMAVGLNMQAAIDNIQPNYVLLSHIQELGHSIDKWRWTFDDALKLKNKLVHDKVYIPCWGERIIYTKKAE